MPSRTLIRAGFLTFALTLQVLLGVVPAHAADDAAVQATLVQLRDADFDGKAELVETLAASNHPRLAPILKALYDSRLYYQEENNRTVIGLNDAAEITIEDAVTGAALGAVSKRSLDRITANNRLRSLIENRLASLGLASADSQQRKAAVEAFMRNPDPSGAAPLRERLAVETDGGIKESLTLALALADLASDDATVRATAATALGGQMQTEIRGRLTRVAADDSDANVREAAKSALSRTEFRLQLLGWAETLFFGLSLGSVLILAAIGLAVTFGVMGVINMAHGELMMLGAYTTWLTQQWLPVNWSLPVAVPLAFLVTALVGIAIERGIIRFLYGRPLETLLATFGVSLILQQAVRSIFSPLNRSVAAPDWMSGTILLGPLEVTLNRLVIVGFCIAVFALLWLALQRTRLGLEVRAVAQNRAMARAMGVRSARVDALTFGLGSGIAGVAGVALSQLTNVGPNLGQSYIVDSFMVVVFGGVGNLWGTMVAGLSLGVANKLLEPWTGAVLAKIVVLVFLILFIQKRPRGLFPQRGRAAEV
ncbi:MAG: urea ABC transporter permease subunit UrtB [Candidatus Competibacteraceae bacterium]|uniref:Urea ABC transporter, permease protein UrtB n=1 Tax=Candidatus Contendobacter odensis Run_B_J11 TaxID=1400861 RepID=A0A7U7GAJ2_9GAMM|nr:urea ABC transporter permease subunit UrtB [Candidatus Contendobacter odensis]MBK8536954.1 urea ABC transporter permease subunit UrtB [Candidatus Competibacteraceae bacterium]MBK8751044.1 urea ABC transporter permease subunit UrtB [Candidatus Competibacteraceae bacterium]CDH44198.1 Urea ABC transporter, permease protein UrtB [Candidatus Contendobacter odensis Run_B_J11]